MESRIASLEREKASLLSASEEAATLLEQLAADNARLRAASSGRGSASGEALRAAQAALALAAGVSEALLEALPRGVAEEERARVEVLVGAAVARAGGAVLAACCGGVVGKAAGEVVEVAGRVVEGEVGGEVAGVVEEMRCRVVALAADGERARGWSEGVAKLKGEGLRKAVKEVGRVCGEEVGSGRAGGSAGVEMVVKEVREKGGVLRERVAGAMEGVKGDVVEAEEDRRKVERLEKELAGKEAEVEDLTVRCAVFEKRVSGASSGLGEEVRRLREEVAEKDARIGELERAGEGDGKAENVSNDVAVGGSPVRRERGEGDGDRVRLALASADLAASRANEVRLRRALAACRYADIAADEGSLRTAQEFLRRGAGARSGAGSGAGEGQEEDAALILSRDEGRAGLVRAAVGSCLRRTRRAAAEASVVVLPDEASGELGRPGRTASICDSQRALALAAGYG